jgi:hypothetical protein
MTSVLNGPITVALKAYVLDTQYEKAFETDVNLRVLRAFRDRGIQPPAILHRDVGAAGGAEQAAGR